MFTFDGHGFLAVHKQTRQVVWADVMDFGGHQEQEEDKNLSNDQEPIIIWIGA